MNAHLKVPLRLLAALAVAGAVLAVGGWAGASGRATNASVGVSADPATTSALSCCQDGSGQGLTVTGEATVRGRGSSARDAAISKAVADATDQANAAGAAAGVTLGKILDIQVSSAPYAYPIYEGNAGSSGGGVAPASNATGSAPCLGVGCPATAPCLCAQPQEPAQQSAGVTITWAIA
jgi:Protein of unknown function (DUF541)